MSAVAAEALRARILELVARIPRRGLSGPPFVPGETPVPVSGKVFDADELARSWTRRWTSG